MLDKIGHVKNPLTVIAMFAALAEVSGTAVLPLIEPATQLIYVVFLTFFPCLLVGLFFYTLWKYPRNLYAPSDYRNEDNFLPATSGAVTAKLTEETREAPVSVSSGGELGIGEHELAEASQGDDTALDEDPQTASLSRSDQQKDLLSQAFLAEQLVIQNLERDLKLNFRRNVSPFNDRSVVLDAVNVTSGKITIVEVRMISKRTPVSQVMRNLTRISNYLLTESEAARGNARVILALVNRDMSSSSLNVFLSRLRAHQDFKLVNVELHLVDMDDLIQANISTSG